MLYLHVFNWPKDGTLRVPGLKTRITDVYLLSHPKQKFAWKYEDDDVLIHAPAVIFDPVNTVIAVKTKGKMEIISNMPALKEGSILLPADFANIHNPGYGTHAKMKGSGDKSVIYNWVDARANLDWMFNSTEPGKYRIEALVRSAENSKMEVSVGNNKIVSDVQSTGDQFDILKLGEIEITETGNQTIVVSPVRESWNPVELMYVELIKL